MPDPLVQVAGLSVTYPGPRRATKLAVDDVDITVRPGETVGLVGESGSGKSSVGNALLGLVPPAAGRIVFDGDDITYADRAQRKLIARSMQVVFQDPYGSMNPVRTVRDTLSESLRYTVALPAPDIDARIERALGDVGIPTSALQRYPGQFSGGQRQRIAIARAIAVEPKFIVCDEAVSALDLSVQAQVLNVLSDLKRERGLAYLFISHDLSVVTFLADTIVVMYAGRVVERGPATQVSAQPGHPYTRMLVASAPVPDPVEQAARRQARHRASTEPRRDVLDHQSCSFANRCPFAIERCRSERPLLEERDDGVAVACHRYEELAGPRPAPGV